MNTSPSGLSNRAFAALDGCTEKRVRTGRVRGELATLPDGTLDAALAGTGWRARNRDAADAGRESASFSRKPNDSGSLAEAQRTREVAIARLRQHQVTERRASVLSVADADTLWRVLREMALGELDDLVKALIGRVATCSDLIELRDTVQTCVYASLNRIAARGEHRRGKSAAPNAMIPVEASRLAAETAKTFALAELRQIDLALAKLEILPMDAVEGAIGLRIDVARQRFLALESILPPRLLGAGGEKQEAVIRAAAADIARLMPEATPTIHTEQVIAPDHHDEGDTDEARGRASRLRGSSGGGTALPRSRSSSRKAAKA